MFAYYDRSDRWHVPSRDLLQAERGSLIVPAPVIPEVDHLLGARLGHSAQLSFEEALAGGYYLIADLPLASYRRVHELNRQYRDLRLGFVDGTVLALAEHLGLSRIATTDRRHFSAVRLAIALELLPT